MASIVKPINSISHKRKTFKLVLIAVMLATTYSLAQEPPKPLNLQTTPMENKKQQVLDFLGRLKTALDLNVIGDPQRLQEVTGFEVLEWREPTPWTAKYATRWRFNTPAMDQTLGMLAVSGVYRTGYRPAENTSYGGGLDIGDFSTVTCISATDMNQIFGEAQIVSKMKAKPLHDLPWIAPFWDVNSYVLNSKTGSLLTLTYNYEDEKKPRPTCLVKLGIDYGLKPPIGY